jgi:hypothetical protein
MPGNQLPRCSELLWQLLPVLFDTLSGTDTVKSTPSEMGGKPARVPLQAR